MSASAARRSASARAPRSTFRAQCLRERGPSPATVRSRRARPLVPHEPRLRSSARDATRSARLRALPPPRSHGRRPRARRPALLRPRSALVVGRGRARRRADRGCGRSIVLSARGRVPPRSSPPPRGTRCPTRARSPAARNARRAGLSRVVSSCPAARVELEGRPPVRREQLRRWLLRPPEARDPLGHRAMLLGTLGSRDLAVGDVPEEHVGERLHFASGLPTDERRCRARKPLRSSPWRSGVAACSSRRRAPTQKTLPTTAATSWRRVFSSGDRPSSRAAMISLRVSGSARSRVDPRSR